MTLGEAAALRRGGGRRFGWPHAAHHIARTAQSARRLKSWRSLIEIAAAGLRAIKTSTGFGRRLHPAHWSKPDDQRCADTVRNARDG